MAIDAFDGAYRFLSNFWRCDVTVQGVVYPTSEHAYQACKSLVPEVRLSMARLKTPGDAKRTGRSIELRPDWGSVKKQVMLTVLVAKFTQNPALADLLVDTDDQSLSEGNTWHDNYWGVCLCPRCKGDGLNYLGRLLMAVRDVVRVDLWSLYQSLRSCARS